MSKATLKIKFFNIKRGLKKLFNEEINENEIKDLSMANFLNIANKDYMSYLNQQIEDFDLYMEQATFIVELDKNKSISTKDLVEYLFINGKKSFKTLITLYLMIKKLIKIQMMEII